MADEPWEPTSAREALILLREAHDAWTAQVADVLGPGYEPADWRTVLRSLHQHAASVLTWARGLDDMADDPVGLSGYPVARAPHAELLDAAVYACNRAIHQLISVGSYSSGGITMPVAFPLTVAGPSLKWVTAESLPPKSADSGPTRKRRRAAYLNQWAGKPMTDGLAEIRVFMDAHIGPAVGL